MNKHEKKQVVSELQEKFEKAKGVVFTDYRGLNVEEISDLRNILRSEALEYRVVKNTLAKIASDGTPIEAAKDIITGPVGIAVGYDDPVLLVKKVLEYSKRNDKLDITGGVIEGSLCTVEQIRAIATLPSREVQLSMLVGAMQSPARTLASLLNSTLTQFIYAFEALKNNKTNS